MAGLVHLGFIVLAFVKSALLGREASRLRASTPNEQAGRTILRSATGFGVLTAGIAVCLAAYYQQPWYKMKSWGEIAKASEEAKVRGVVLSDEEASFAARKKMLAEHGQATGVQYGASVAVVLLGLSWLVGLRAGASAPHATRLLVYASVGVLGLGLLTTIYLVQPWGSTRKATESDTVIRATWPNDPTPSQEQIDDVLYWKEFKEKKGAWGFLIGVFVICVSSIAGGYLTARKMTKSRNTMEYSGNLRVLRRAIVVVGILGIFSLVFRATGMSGVMRGLTGSEMARGWFKTIVEAETEFHDKDIDGNGVKDWWVGDVSCLHRILIGGKPIGLVDKHLVQADESPLESPKGKLQLEPIVRENVSSQYHVAVIPLASDGTPYAHDDAEGHAVLSHKGFAFCGFPSKYRTYGVDTLIVDQTGVVWRKDIGGARVQRWPQNPENEGWKKWIDGLPRRPDVYVLGEEGE